MLNNEKVACKPFAVLQNLDPRQLQIALTGFLEKNTSLFVKVLACLSPSIVLAYQTFMIVGMKYL